MNDIVSIRKIRPCESRNADDGAGAAPAWGGDFFLGGNYLSLSVDPEPLLRKRCNPRMIWRFRSFAPERPDLQGRFGKPDLSTACCPSNSSTATTTFSPSVPMFFRRRNTNALMNA